MTKKRYIDFHGCIAANLTIRKLPIVAQSQIDKEILVKNRIYISFYAGLLGKSLIFTNFAFTKLSNQEQTHS